MDSLIRAGKIITNNYIYSRRVWMSPLLLARSCRRKNNRMAGGMDILIRSGMIYYKWPNLIRESLDASIIWLWTNSQGTGDWDVMMHMCVTVMPMLQNAISQTAESHLGMNNLRSGIIYHKQLRFQLEFGCFLCCYPEAAEQTVERSVI